MKRLIIDGDGCPSLALIRKVAQENTITHYVFIDDAHPLKDEDETIVYVDQGKDHVDMAILQFIKEEDLVLTQDYGLASLVLSKNSHALNPKGIFYTKENIDSFLMSRYLNAKLRKQNKRYTTMKKRALEDDQALIKSILSYFETE